MEKRYYIAYGSNLNVRQMRMRCPTARIIGTSVLKDYELLFKGSKTGSYLTVEKKPGTIAYICALYGMEVIDSGVPVLSMHAPQEIINKADLFEAVKAYRAFMIEG